MAIIENLKGEHNKRDTYKRAFRVLFSLLFPIFATLIYWQANNLAFDSITDYMDVKGQQQSQQYANLLLQPVKENKTDQIRILLTGLTSQPEVVSAVLYDKKGVRIDSIEPQSIPDISQSVERNTYLFVAELVADNETHGYLSVNLNAELIKSHFESIQNIQHWQLLIFFVLSFILGCWITNRWYKSHLEKKYRPKNKKAAL
ncbi:MAG: hypothetical protein GJ680_02610 [Alteromonadaceae bacterium]|nr:hypothetical protein [Alteromonadaceae bacterium]